MTAKKASASADSTLANISTHSLMRPKRIARRVVLIVLSAFIRLVLFQVFGSSTTKSITANGMTVTVDYPRAGRAGMPDSVVIQLRGGSPLGEPVTISISEG